MRPPPRVIHTDWSLHPGKRWWTCGLLRQDGGYDVTAPRLVGRLEHWPPPGPEPTFTGIDAPLGVPLAYGRKAGIDAFPRWLDDLVHPPWTQFFEVAREPNEIGLHRPFYPHAPGGRSRDELVQGLGLDSPDALFRVCDRRTPERPAACPLFWTLGANQVGKAAIVAWRDLVLPRRPRLRLWPFEGRLFELLGGDGPVLAETYPTEVALHLGVESRGKRTQTARKRAGRQLLNWARSRPVRFGPSLQHQLEDGFGEGSDGEDPFDSVLGLSGLLNVVLGYRTEGRHPDPDVEAIEGWILGQTPTP